MAGFEEEQCHLPIAAAFFSIGDGLSEKTVLYMHTLLANYFFLSCQLDVELYCGVELGNFCPNPLSSSTPNFGYASVGLPRCLSCVLCQVNFQILVKPMQ